MTLSSTPIASSFLRSFKRFSPSFPPSTSSSPLSSMFVVLLLTISISIVHTAEPWNENAASGMKEGQFFLTAYLGTYCGAFGSWLLVLGGVALYCKCTASNRSQGLRPDGKMNFESFEQSMIMHLRSFGRFSIICLFVCHGWLGYLYYISQEPLVTPFFGIARPLSSFLIAVFGWFADSHPMFRWIVSLKFFEKF